MLNKLILSAILSLSLAFSFTGTANATLISQDIISDADGVIGHISINLDTAQDVGYGYSSVYVWEELSLFGFDMSPPSVADGFQFFAEYNTGNLSEGIQNLYLDVNDIYDAYAWQLTIFDGFGGMEDVFNLDTGNLAYFAADVSFGQATVVPTPATLVLFLTAVAGLASRRKNS